MYKDYIWGGSGKGVTSLHDTYYVDLLNQLLPAIKKKYAIASHTRNFCERHGITI